MSILLSLLLHSTYISARMCGSMLTYGPADLPIRVHVSLIYFICWLRQRRGSALLFRACVMSLRYMNSIHLLRFVSIFDLNLLDTRHLLRRVLSAVNIVPPIRPRQNFAAYSKPVRRTMQPEERSTRCFPASH